MRIPKAIFPFISRSTFQCIERSSINHILCRNRYYSRDHHWIFLDSSTRLMSSGNNEVSAAKKATPDDASPTIFDKILSKEWSSDKVYEDDIAYAFRDINPQAPIHILVIPKKRDGLTMLSKAKKDQQNLLGHLMFVAQEIGKKECPKGFRVVINDGEQGCQSVYHLHLHVIGGRQLNWPPG